MYIVAEILSIIQYLETLKDKSKFYRLAKCLCCGNANPWLHGCYSRKADRSGAGEVSLNPVRIQRFFCPNCGRTCSVLPEFIPPNRWYPWDVQQAALLLLLVGESCRAVENKITPSRHTIRRWFNRFREQFSFHKDTLCNHFAELGRAANFTEFWLSCLNAMPLSKAMRLCHASGVPVP